MRQATKLTISTQPLDEIDTSKCYKGQIVYNPNTKKCYVYGGDPLGWTEISSVASSKDKPRDKALICESCWAALQSPRCSYCGTWHWYDSFDFLEVKYEI